MPAASPARRQSAGGGQNSASSRISRAAAASRAARAIVRHRRQPLSVFLDADRDGVVSAEEIANASTALLTLDKDGDGQLTRQELCPRPQLNNARNNRNSGDQ